MKKIKIFLLIICIGFVYSCGVVKEGFKSPKKNKSDEFLVEKKSPLVLPPNFNELPEPKETNESAQPSEKNIKDLIKNSEENTKAKNKKSNLEGSVLEKILEN